MKKTLAKITVLFAWTLLMLNIFSVAFINVGSAVALPDYIPMHIEPDESVNAALNLEMPLVSYVSEQHSSCSVGDYKLWFARDAYYGYYFITSYQLRAIGTTAEIWVQADLSWPEGDPRPYPTILDEQVEYLLEEFENNIYPTDTAYFGAPDFHDGANALFDDWLGLPPDYYYDETGRNVILVSNVRDENYWDYTYPYYIIGFYTGNSEPWVDRNVITIDSNQWERRIGPEGYEWIPGIFVTRPYTYEGTIAHEYQHLIHADKVPGDSSFMNEGCSMYAEILCGYGVSWNHVNHFLYTPDNSLAKWGDQGGINVLADYGASTLWAVYLNDNYSPKGESFLRHYMEAGIPADYGVNAALAYFGYPKTFDDVYYEWNLANYLHSAKRSPFTYKSIDLNYETNPNVIPMNIHTMKPKFPMSFYGSDFGSTINIYGYDTGVVDLAPYSSDYILFGDWEDDAILYFDGGEASEIPYGWEMVDDEWYSDGVNLLNTLIAAEVHVDTENPELEITTYWDIEDYWDFGFVQISTDGGISWTSLANEYTTSLHDPSAYFPIVANLPGLTSWSGYITPSGWITMTFDLSDYAGMDVMLGFRYMTDWGTLYEGWYISSVEVSETSIPLDSFEKVAGYPSYFTVTVVHLAGDIDEPSSLIVKGIETLDIDHIDETGQKLIPGKGQNVLVVVSNPSDPTLFQYGSADYHITIEEV